jgi:hypothetical protein
MTEDEYRVEIELDDPDHGFTLSERFKAVDLDDEARDRLGSRVIVTRDGSHLFLYANTRESCAEAERVARELIAQDELTADIRSTRWHPHAGDWEDADAPLPGTAEEVAAEESGRAERESEADDGIKRPEFVMLGSYKPDFLRDLGL